VAPTRIDVLRGIRVIDLSALGPGPFASMLLGDYGAEVLAIRRPHSSQPDPARGLNRNKHEVTLDLRAEPGAELIRRLAAKADVVLESFRPGVAERLGLGPKELGEVNSRLIYVRLTGWGQEGPYATRAGHDINYLAISGALAVSGVDTPTVPPALLGDLANGSYLAVIGILLALIERQKTGCGRVVDAAIVDGAALMLSAIFGELRAGQWSGMRGEHVLSGNAPFYGVYRCADSRWFSVGAIESKFYAALLGVLGLADVERSHDAQWDRTRWPALRERVAAVFRTRDRDAWSRAFEAEDACGAPVLEVHELADDCHLAARGTIERTGPGLRAAPAPRLSGQASSALPERSGDARALLLALGIEETEIDTLIDDGTIAY
jgi:alpha-methylacyl-CoA racemase